jgi:hypothetical protein
MRTRTKYEETVFTTAGTGQIQSSSWNGGGYWNPWGGYVNQSIPAYLKSDGESVIIDDITPAQGVKSVTHTKRKFSISVISEYYENTATNRYHAVAPGDIDYHRKSWGSYGKLQLSNISASYPKTINQLRSETMHAFHDMNEVDGLLNAVESPQLIRSARDIRDYILNFRKDRDLRRALRRDAGLIAGGFLGWTFGIAPLLADMKKVDNALRNIRTVIDSATRKRKYYTVTRRCYGNLTPNISATGYSAANVNTGWWHVGIYPQVTPYLLVGVRGRRQIDYSSPALQKADYLLRRFFSTGPASFVWERIPFSFVVDWFVNLSGVVDSLDNVLTGMSRQIDSAWMSEKWHALVPVYKHQYGAWTSDSDGKQTALNEMSYYHREPISTDPTISLSGRFGKKQAAITVALLHQIVADLTRKTRR